MNEIIQKFYSAKRKKKEKSLRETKIPPIVNLLIDESHDTLRIFVLKKKRHVHKSCWRVESRNVGLRRVVVVVINDGGVFSVYSFH